MRRVVVGALVMTLACVPILPGCGAQGREEAADRQDETDVRPEPEGVEDGVSGGWSIDEQPVSQLTKEQEELFAQATEMIFGTAYTPVAVLGSQVVAGVNYAYLCQGAAVLSDAQQGWYVVVIYESLEGDAEVISSTEIDVSDVRLAEESQGDVVGGWTIVAPADDRDVLSDDVAGAFGQAVDAGDEKVVPVALLGTQVVSGIKYRMLVCDGSTEEDAEARLCLAEMYVDSNGTARFTSLEPFDLLAYV